MNKPFKDPLVSIVVVTWNRRDELLETIASVYAQSYPDFEIVIVDNGSNDGTVESIRARYADVKVVALNRNAGPTEGRNIGVTHAEGEIIFFLDSDASMGEHTLRFIVDKFHADPTLGAVACKVVNAYTKGYDDIPTPGWYLTERDKVLTDQEFPSFSFSECGCAIYKPAFEEAGQFWEHLFFGREGEELSLRIWDAGYTIWYCSQAVVYHRISPNERVENGEREYFDLRNCLYTYIVRYPWWMLLRLLPLKIGAAVVRNARSGQLYQVWRALQDVARQSIFLWKMRHPIQDSTAQLYCELLKDHGPLSWKLASWLKYKT